MGDMKIFYGGEPSNAAQQAHLDDLKDDARAEQDAEWRERMVESMDSNAIFSLSLLILARNANAREFAAACIPYDERVALVYHYATDEELKA